MLELKNTKQTHYCCCVDGTVQHIYSVLSRMDDDFLLYSEYHNYLLQNKQNYNPKEKKCYKMN